jgi:hypothetical protein
MMIAWLLHGSARQPILIGSVLTCYIKNDSYNIEAHI